MLEDEIKHSATLKVWAKLSSAMEIANDPNIYWKMDPERQRQLNERDRFDQQVWSYILGLIEKDNVL